METPNSLRFAVLWHHQIAEPHFDFLVETKPGSDLATWRSPVWPILESTPLVRLKDHRRIYLEYDGEISEGRGRVDRIGSGTCRVETDFDGAWTLRFIELPGGIRLDRVNAEQWEASPI